ncbi:MAG: 4-(cytidine 5'-diphospho)-2-C-methyl-D-erythritol kinase [Christensenellales bacterium]
MRTARIRAGAKINWALSIKGIRPDRLHELDMLVQSISLYDDIELRASDSVSVECEGGPSGKRNIAYKAAAAYQRESGKGAAIYIKKHIPMQAGLGGGSSDAAGVLLGMNAIYGKFTTQRLLELAAETGADVPFLMHGGLARVRGAGEVIEPLKHRDYHLVIAKPNRGISTAEAYQLYDEGGGEQPDMDKVTEAVKSGRAGGLKNALHRSAARLCPDIDRLIACLMGEGASEAGMSGSGSAVFGVFASERAAKAACKNIDVWSAAVHTTKKAVDIIIE